MFHGDKGKPNKYPTMRLNFDIVIDNERLTLQKMSRRLGFFTILFSNLLLGSSPGTWMGYSPVKQPVQKPQWAPLAMDWTPSTLR